MKGNKAFVNEFNMHDYTLNKIAENEHMPSTSSLPIGDMSFQYHQLLSPEEVSLINEQIDAISWVPVGKDGIASNYKENEEIGSYRLSCFEQKLADSLWGRIKPYLPSIRIMNELSPTDWDGSYEWEPIGVNSLFRFIRYNKNGFLIPHYDAPFIQDENIRSLSSLVIYLSDNPGTGGTRFLTDKQQFLPLEERNYADWKHEASEEIVEYKINPSKGDALLFDHRILHDSERMKGEEVKTIIRTDIMYRRVL